MASKSMVSTPKSSSSTTSYGKRGRESPGPGSRSHPSTPSTDYWQTTENKPLSTNTPSSLVCDICHKNFTSKSNLNKHRRVQHSGEEHECPYCERLFKNKYYIKNHIKLCSPLQKSRLPHMASSPALLQQEPCNLSLNLPPPVPAQSAQPQKTTQQTVDLKENILVLPSDLSVRRAPP